MTSIDQEAQAGEAFDPAAHHADAVDAHRRAVDADRSDALAWIGLSEALREVGRWDEAVDAARRALRLSAAAPAGRLARIHIADALALLGARRNSEAPAAAAAAVALAERAGDPQLLAAALRAQALARLRTRRLNEAGLAAETAMRLFPDYPEGMATLASIRMLQNRAAEADALFRRATAAKDTLAEAFANHAALLAGSGREQEALQAALRAVRLKPFLAEAQNLAGALLLRFSQPDAAAAAFAAALQAEPDHSTARVNLADLSRRSGRPAEAAEICRAGLALRPGEFRLLVNLGAALQALGDADSALAAYEQAKAAAAAQNDGALPDLPEIDNNIARIHLAAGRLDQAERHLRRAAAARPDDPAIAFNLASTLLNAGRTQEAEAPARLALAGTPQDCAAHMLLGRILTGMDRAEEAEAAFLQAVRLAPAGAVAADLWAQAGIAFLRAGLRPRATAFLRQATALAPDDQKLWALLGQSFRGVRFTRPNDALRADLLAALDRPGVEITHLIEAAASLLLLSPATAQAAAPTASDRTIRLLLTSAEPGGPVNDPLTLRLLELAVVPDPALERAFTRMRRVLLDLCGAEPEAAAGLLDFACALAFQCHLNEYAWAETPAETVAADRLAAALQTEIAAGRTPNAFALAICAAYRPPHRPAGAAALLQSVFGHPALDRLLTRLVAEPLAEEAMKAALPRLTPVADPVSCAVRRQYEENPHPRWTVAGLLNRPVPVPAAIRAMFPHVVLPADPRWDAPEILVAGCGTGRESLWAADQFAGASVLAADLSLASLAYARRQSERLGIRNIVYGQADILQLETLGRRFDIVQSVGVLHHMDDPATGWRVLTDLLRPGGLMKIGLYSERARAAVVAGRAFIAANGYGSSTEEIRRFRQDVLALPDDHPVHAAARSVDFFSTSACRDLLFHVQESRTSPLEIGEMIKRSGMEFLGFQLDDPATARSYRSRFPEDAQMTSLDGWEAFEKDHPATFASLYQFWLRRPS
jgi:tetratricopeptide (TPR) repeat protein/SAM-dependent methyltransferase